MPRTRARRSSFFFFRNDTAPSEIYTLSLHDALPISATGTGRRAGERYTESPARQSRAPDRKSTRLNSSHVKISYAVFCLQKKKIKSVQSLHTPHARHPTSHYYVASSSDD